MNRTGYQRQCTMLSRLLLTVFVINTAVAAASLTISVRLKHTAHIALRAVYSKRNVRQ
jgi:hypothetical protein